MSEHNSEMPRVLSLIICGTKGFAVGVIAAAVLLFVFTGIAYGVDDPEALLTPLGFTALLASSAVTGAVAGASSHTQSPRSALYGAVGGVMLLLAVLLLSFIPAEAPRDALSPAVKLLMYGAIPLLSAACGAVFGKRRRKRRGGHRRRR